MLQWPWEDLVCASSCPFKARNNRFTMLYPYDSYDGCVPELCAGTPREFSPRWLQHGDGGTVETCFVATDGCVFKFRMALELLRDEASSNVSYMFPLYITIYLWSCHVILSHIYRLSICVFSRHQVMDCQDLHLDDASIAYSSVFCPTFFVFARSSFGTCFVTSLLHTFAPYHPDAKLRLCTIAS